MITVSILQGLKQTSLLCSSHVPPYFYINLIMIIAQNCEKSYFLLESKTYMGKNCCFITRQQAGVKNTDKILKIYNLDSV